VSSRAPRSLRAFAFGAVAFSAVALATNAQAAGVIRDEYGSGSIDLPSNTCIIDPGNPARACAEIGAQPTKEMFRGGASTDTHLVAVEHGLNSGGERITWTLPVAIRWIPMPTDGALAPSEIREADVELDRKASELGIRLTGASQASVRADGLQVLRREAQRPDGSWLIHASLIGASRAVSIDVAGPVEDPDVGRRALDAIVEGVHMSPPATLRRRFVHAAVPLVAGLPSW
jgi:hypothetical protein